MFLIINYKEKISCNANIFLINKLLENIIDNIQYFNKIIDTSNNQLQIIINIVTEDINDININNIHDLKYNNILSIKYINNFNENEYIDDIILYLDSEFYYPNIYYQNILSIVKSCNSIYINKYYLYDYHTNNVFFHKNKILLAKNLKIDKNNIITNNDLQCIKINYYYNDIDKLLLYSSLYNNNEYFSFINDNSILSLLIQDDILIKYKNFYQKNIILTSYDIVYLTGGGGITWMPYDKNLGGSEQAIVHLTREWSKSKDIYVYGNFEKEIDLYNDINFKQYYKMWYNYPFLSHVKNLIIWRKSGLYILLKTNINADNIILDLHDNFSYTLESMNKEDLIYCFNKITYFNFKSNYHKTCFFEFLKRKNINLINKQYNVIMNGLRIDDFKKNNNIPRQKYRFCYCSSYDRGLSNIIINIWNKIYEKCPDAEFHVYYGMDYIFDTKFKTSMQYLLGEKGIMDHGRCTMDYIIKEKQCSMFHIYLTDSEAEIDCINIRESLISGCIPLLFDINVFKERDGIKFNVNDGYDIIVNKILTIMEQENYLNDERDFLLKSKTIVGWNDISTEWLQKCII